MSLPNTPASISAYDDPFTLDDMPKITRPIPTAPADQPPAKQKQGKEPVKRAKHHKRDKEVTATPAAKPATFNASEAARIMWPSARPPVEAPNKAKAAPAEGAKKQGRPAIVKESKDLAAERLQRSREAAAQIVQQSVAHTLYCVEEDLKKTYGKASKVLKDAISDGIRRACGTAMHEALEKIQLAAVAVEQQ